MIEQEKLPQKEDTEKKKELLCNKRFTSYKNTILINPYFDGNIEFTIRKEDILAYHVPHSAILQYDYEKEKGYTEGTIDEWLKENDFDESYKKSKYHSIVVLFSQRIAEYVDDFLEEPTGKKGEYIFYYDFDDGELEVYRDDLKHLEDL